MEYKKQFNIFRFNSNIIDIFDYKYYKTLKKRVFFKINIIFVYLIIFIFDFFFKYIFYYY